MKNFAVQLGLKIVFFTNNETKQVLSKMCDNYKNLNVSYQKLMRWEDFLIITKATNEHDVVAVISARKYTLSYNPLLEKVPYYLTKYFSENNFFLIFPKQTLSHETTGKLFNPLHV